MFGRFQQCELDLEYELLFGKAGKLTRRPPPTAAMGTESEADRPSFLGSRVVDDFF